MKDVDRREAGGVVRAKPIELGAMNHRSAAARANEAAGSVGQ
jgi:hypothetical protein